MSGVQEISEPGIPTSYQARIPVNALIQGPDRLIR